MRDPTGEQVAPTSAEPGLGLEQHRSIKRSKACTSCEVLEFTAAELAEVINAVKARGYSKPEGLLNIGHAAMSSPIIDCEGRLAGALTLLGPASDFDRQTELRFSKLLLTHANAFSASIGRRG